MENPETSEEAMPQVQDVVVRLVLHPDYHADIVSTLWENPWPDWLIDAEIICEGKERDANADELISMGHDTEDEPENREET